MCSVQPRQQDESGTPVGRRHGSSAFVQFLWRCSLWLSSLVLHGVFILICVNTRVRDNPVPVESNSLPVELLVAPERATDDTSLEDCEEKMQKPEEVMPADARLPDENDSAVEPNTLPVELLLADQESAEDTSLDELYALRPLPDASVSEETAGELPDSPQQPAAEDGDGRQEGEHAEDRVAEVEKHIASAAPGTAEGTHDGNGSGTGRENGTGEAPNVGTNFVGPKGVVDGYGVGVGDVGDIPMGVLQQGSDRGLSGALGGTRVGLLSPSASGPSGPGAVYPAGKGNGSGGLSAPAGGNAETRGTGAGRATKSSYGTPQEDAALKAQYLAGIMAKLARSRTYPQAARRRGLEGVVKIEFTVLLDGRVREVRVAVSSGSELLDRAAAAIVERAAPFDPLPPRLAGRPLQLVVPIVFSLTGGA